MPGDKGQRGKLGRPGVPGEKDNDHQTNVTTGVVYIRWGRTSCPGDAQLLYKGRTGLALGCKNSLLEQANTEHRLSTADSSKDPFFIYGPFFMDLRVLMVKLRRSWQLPLISLPITPVKKSVNHSRAITSMRTTRK